MLIRTIMLTAVFTVASWAPTLTTPAQAAKTDEAKSSSFQHVSNSVRTIQKKLLKAGYSDVRVDGIFGPETSRAIIQYQKKNGLPQSGFPDAGFLEHLNKKLAGKPQ